jgi:hypothetical protein
VAKWSILYRNDMEQKLKVFLLRNLKNISSNELLNQILPEFRGNLQSINPQRKQSLCNSISIVISHMFFQFCFMISDDILADKFQPFYFPFVDNNLMVLTKLYFIIFDWLIKMVILSTFFNVMYDLQQINRYWEDLPSRLQYFLILFILYFILLLQIDLIFWFFPWTPHDRLEFWFHYHILSMLLILFYPYLFSWFES